MPNKATMTRIDEEIAAGKLGIARDRLHGLVLAYPTDLALRSKLGDVYWKLGYPRTAGLYWFLDFPQDELKQGAVAAYVKECGGDPSVILRRLKLRCAPEQFLDVSARAQIQIQIDECIKKNIPVPAFPTADASNPVHPNPDAFMVGCLIAVIVAIFLCLVGAYTVYGWVQNR